jgi:hypothetical protein
MLTKWLGGNVRVDNTNEIIEKIPYLFAQKMVYNLLQRKLSTYKFTALQQIVGQNQIIKVGNKCRENVEIQIFRKVCNKQTINRSLNLENVSSHSVQSALPSRPSAK